MRHALLSIVLLMLCIQHTRAQENWQKILRTDPFLSNGYFIVSPTQWQALNIDHMEVDIVMATLQSNGSISKQTIQTISINEPMYVQANLEFLTTLSNQQFVYYHLRGFNVSGDKVVDVDAGNRDCVDCEGESWPLFCTQVCNGPSYAWALDVFSNGSQSEIYLDNARIDGMPLYFYVKSSDNAWVDFKDQFDPIDFGYADPYSWDQLANNPPEHLEDAVIAVSNIPVDAHDYQGHIIGNSAGGGYAIAKRRGPWAYALLQSNVIDGATPNYICQEGNQILDIFNADSQVQAQRAQQNVPEVTCHAIITPGGSGVSWSPNSSSICTSFEITYSSDEHGLDILTWAINAVECPTWDVLYPSQHELGSLEGIGGVVINGWDENGRTSVFDLWFPEKKDPKLIPVTKTALSPGLYEFMIFMDDGSVIRQFQAFNENVVIIADFSSFVNVNIYPVPVQGREFAVDFDLPSPMDISMTVVNNMGIEYFHKELSFPLAGHNKFVVPMEGEWPSGLYHAIFNYPNGTAGSKNFTVE